MIGEFEFLKFQTIDGNPYPNFYFFILIIEPVLPSFQLDLKLS